jgi:hypothetical protein
MDFVQLLLAVLFIVAVATALLFWDKILYWADKTLFPWIKENYPGLEKYVRYAFAAVNKVVKPIRNNIKALAKLTEIKGAWKMLRKYLLKVLVQFEYTQNQWVRRIISWATRKLESNEELESKEVVVRRVTEEIVDPDSLPNDVSDEWLRRGKNTYDIDVTKLHDRELDEYERELTMTNSN